MLQPFNPTFFCYFISIKCRDNHNIVEGPFSLEKLISINTGYPITVNHRNIKEVKMIGIGWPLESIT